MGKAFYQDVVEPLYSRREELEGGHYGRVFIVTERKTNQTFVMKMIGKDNPRVLDKMRVLKCCIHPHIIYLHDFFETTYFFHIVMKHMNAGNFRQRICDLTPTLSKFYFHQMCDAVKFLHSKGIIHRDLKPENMLLRSKDTKTLLVFSDFGLHLPHGTIRICQRWFRQPIYLAPEVLKDDKNYSKSADIWSLGVILLECLNGKPAFPTVEHVQEGTLDFHDFHKEDVLRNVKSLIKAILVSDPKCRASINSILKCSWMNDMAVKKDVEEIRKKYIPR